jgi:HEAT repeat protein
MKALLNELGPHGDIAVLLALRMFGPEAKEAIPVVTALTRHKSAPVRHAAFETLKKIDPKALMK